MHDLLEKLTSTYSVARISEVRDKITQKLDNWEEAIHKKLLVDNPFARNQKKYTKALTSFANGTFTIAALKNDFFCYQELASMSTCLIDEHYWSKEIEKYQKRSSPKHTPKDKETLAYDLKLTRKVLLKQWEKSLDEEYIKWELSEIEKHRSEMFKKMEDWLRVLQKYRETTKELSPETEETGFLFDLTQGNLTVFDVEKLDKWVSYISKKKALKNLCDKLGRSREVSKSTTFELIRQTTPIEETIKYNTHKEEIIGITIGNDLTNVLPQELALLGDEETSILFDKKYVEEELMCFDLEGTTERTVETIIESTQAVTEREELGPMILCIDTSGSMNGSPETIAKAIALYLSTRAKSQKRDCFLINFSTNIETFDLSSDTGLEQLLTFLGRSFHGGTDVTPAMQHAIEKMQTNRYRNADLIVISDFVLGSLPKHIEQSVQEARREKNKFHSLSIGNFFMTKRLKNLFDSEWLYNPSDSSVTLNNEDTETALF